MRTQQIITLALGDLGVLGLGESLDTPEANDALIRLNLLVSSLQLDPPWAYIVNKVSKTLTAGTSTYTIGPGAAIDTPRPDIPPDYASLTLSITAPTPVEVPVAVYTKQQYQRLPIKTLQSGLVRGIYIDQAFNANGYATLFVWPVPTIGTTALNLWLPGVAVGQFADLAVTDYTFPPGYLLAIIKSLAVDLAVPYGRPVTPELYRAQADALTRVERTNAQNHLDELQAPEAATMAGGYGGRAWNYRTDDYT